MTTKEYMNDFYNQLEELNKKLDKANEKKSRIVIRNRKIKKQQ